MELASAHQRPSRLEEFSPGHCSEPGPPGRPPKWWEDEAVAEFGVPCICSAGAELWVPWSTAPADWHWLISIPKLFFQKTF